MYIDSIDLQTYHYISVLQRGNDSAETIPIRYVNNHHCKDGLSEAFLVGTSSDFSPTAPEMDSSECEDDSSGFEGSQQSIFNGELSVQLPPNYGNPVQAVQPSNLFHRGQPSLRRRLFSHPTRSLDDQYHSTDSVENEYDRVNAAIRMLEI